jgi:hypothetical protein
MIRKEHVGVRVERTCLQLEQQQRSMSSESKQEQPSEHWQTFNGRRKRAGTQKQHTPPESSYRLIWIPFRQLGFSGSSGERQRLAG